ncbi:hypothetical protein [Anaerocaecibacter muris]|uniref:hypothetical protein n=1 Tax=Anaerocaecibacter muris TaxID=2941513 RepID=UPI0020424895|nr:hypothetical protein [Anaerocaecibacter muris]MCX4312847.1 hypothetical protein [Clostridia bacterium]
MDKLLIAKILAKIKKTPTDYQAYEDLFSLCRAAISDERKEALSYSTMLRSICEKSIRQLSGGIIPKLVKLSNRTLLFEAPYLFDSYMQYLEINRKPQERFYLPRRKRLKEVVDAIQELVDDELDELFISMPPRVGKTTLIMFALTWIVGRNSELSNLYSAYSDVITAAMYSGALEVINDSYTYTWHEIFPDCKIANTNAKDEILNIDRKKRYPSLTCRSLYGTLNGACDCNGFLVSDDLIGGIEEALNKDRLASAWFKVDNNLIPRAKENAKRLWVGTRWSMVDPAGVRMDLLINDPTYATVRYKIINIPALDPETDESNFDYQYGVGFSTEYYRQRRASFERNNDIASWNAQYMGEPIERDGTLFAPEDLRYYNGILPDGEPDRIFMACDPAFGGGDFVSAPVAFQYDNDVFIHDLVFNAGDKKITRPMVVELVLRNKVQAAQFEANNGGEEYQEWVEARLKEKGYRLNITSKRAQTTKKKELRIFDKAPEIREFYFLEQGKRSKEYSQFMMNLFSFKITGKNKNDDAPDSLAMLVEMRDGTFGGKPEIFRRPF